MSLIQHFSKHFVTTLMSLALSLLILAGCVYFYMFFQLPDVATLKETKLQIPLRIFTSEGELIAEYGAMRRDPVTLDEVPKSLLNAIIATEDQRFFEHSGVDFIGILRAAKELILTGQKNQGASTISMQVARNFFLTREKTFTRKINEVLLALKITSTFSKEKILELYLNKIYLGQHAYGVSAAAAIYYGKSLQELTLPEMATIAGLPQAPSRENPITNPAAAKMRRDHVLQRMLESKYITQKECEEATQAPIATYYHGPKISVPAPHIGEMVRGVMYQQFGEDAYTHGLRVYTTLDGHLQKAADATLRDGLIAYEKRHRGYRGPEKNLGKLPSDLSIWQKTLGDAPQNDGFVPAAIMQLTSAGATALLANGRKITIPAANLAWTGRSKNIALKVGDLIRVIEKEESWQLAQIPQVQGSLVALNPEDGAVLALNGGFNNSENGFNRAIQAERQPGSNFKPFIYAAALNKGYTLATIVNNAPLEVNDTGDPNNPWRPQNADKTFSGPTRMHVGLVRSLNLVSIRILQMTGIPYTIEYLTQFGFDRKKLPPSLSLALGTASVTPIQMAAGYTVFANGGYRVTPYFIRQIQADDGSVLYQANPAVASGYVDASNTQTQHTIAQQVIEPEIAYLMTHVLQDVIKSGTGYGARTLNRNDLSGKTGTSNDYIDAWFSGFNRHIETTVWVGYDQPRSLNEYGGVAALPIWVNFMKVALANIPAETLTPPEGIVSARIDPDSGLLANPEQENAIFEVFRSDTVPTETADTNSTSIDTGSGENNNEIQLF